MFFLRYILGGLNELAKSVTKPVFQAAAVMRFWADVETRCYIALQPSATIRPELPGSCEGKDWQRMMRTPSVRRTGAPCVAGSVLTKDEACNGTTNDWLKDYQVICASARSLDNNAGNHMPARHFCLSSKD